MDINELYSDLKVKHEQLKRLYSHLQKQHKEMTEEFKKLRKIAETEAPTGYVKEKTHRKLQERQAQLNKYVRELESGLVDEKGIRYKS